MACWLINFTSITINSGATQGSLGVFCSGWFKLAGYLRNRDLKIVIILQFTVLGYFVQIAFQHCLWLFQPLFPMKYP